MDLPLSWTRSGTGSFNKKTCFFKTNKLPWISLADIPETDSFGNIIDNLKKTHPDRILLRGCPPGIAAALRQKDFEILPIGQEAIIDLNEPVFNNRSLRQSARNGNRHNNF